MQINDPRPDVRRQIAFSNNAHWQLMLDKAQDIDVLALDEALSPLATFDPRKREVASLAASLQEQSGYSSESRISSG